VSSKKRRVKDKWRGKDWYKTKSPPYFGGVELGALPSDEPTKLLGRIIDATLYDITNDFAHQYLKMYFQVTDVDGKTAQTIFKGHEYDIYNDAKKIAPLRHVGIRKSKLLLTPTIVA